MEWLELFGHDLASAPSISANRCPGGPEKLRLYAWENYVYAERFAIVLNQRLYSDQWVVTEFDQPLPESTALAPLTIIRSRLGSGWLFELFPAACDRIRKAFPSVAIRRTVFYTNTDYAAFWTDMTTALTGLTPEQLKTLGGAHVYARSTAFLCAVPMP